MISRDKFLDEDVRWRLLSFSCAAGIAVEHKVPDAVLYNVSERNQMTRHARRFAICPAAIKAGVAPKFAEYACILSSGVVLGF